MALEFSDKSNAVNQGVIQLITVIVVAHHAISCISKNIFLYLNFNG
jgi:hypothetical protein